MERSSPRPETRHADLPTWTRDAGAHALAVWEEIRSRNEDPYADIREDEYREYSGRVREFTRESKFLHLAIDWARWGDNVQRRYGQMLVIAESLRPIIESLDKLRTDYPTHVFQTEDLIRNGLEYAWRSFDKDNVGYSNIGEILWRVKRHTYRTGKNIVNPRPRRETPVSVVPRAVEEVSAEPAKEQEKWGTWLKIASLGSVAAIVVLSLIGTKGNKVDVKLHNVSGAGVTFEWNEFGLVDHTKPLWDVHMERPPSPSQLVTRKSLDLTINGARFEERESKRIIRSDIPWRKN